MPYGMPGAATLKGCYAIDQNGKKLVLQHGQHCQPLYPCADQDGYDGHWMVYVPKLGNVVVEKEAFL